MDTRPTTAFVLSLVGGVLTLVLGSIGAVATAAFIFGFSSAFSPGAGSVPSLDAAFGLIALFLIAGIVCSAVIIVGAALQYSDRRSRVRMGSIIVLIGTIVAVPFTFFGAIVGFVLSLTGAVMGLRWQPPAATPPSPITS